MSDKLIDRQPMKPDVDTLARWWVQLNVWVWPPDLPGKPNPPGGSSERQMREAIRGAHAVIDTLADPELVDAIWQDDEARRALIDAGGAGAADVRAD